MSEQETRRKTNLKISGMTCASCVATIEKSVKNLDGVLDVNVNLSTEKANLEYDSSKIDLSKIEKTVNELGYKVVNDKPGAKIDVKIGGMHCANCVTTLEKAIGNIEGVASVNVNLSTERAVIDLDPGLASIDDVKKAITGAGYQFLGTRDEMTLDAEKEAIQANLRDKKRRAIVGMAVGIPLFIMMFVWPFSLARMYTMFAIATPAFIYTSYPIFKAMYASLKNRSLNMDVMYGMGIGVAYGSSVAGTFLGPFIPALMQFMFYDASVLLAGFLMFGRFLEAKAKSKTSDAIKKLVGLQPKTAIIIREGQEQVIPAVSIVIGDVILVKPGEKIPADGIVIEGTSYVDEAMITGEPIPVLKESDSKVVGGTINKNSVLTFEAQKVGKDTILSQIIKLVEEAQGTKPPIQKLADKAVTWFIPVVLAIAITTFVSWLLVSNDWLEALTRLITILVIACPCALGLATPTAVTVGIGRGAELGILIKNGEVLEKVNKLTTVIFDKTGTLTNGKPDVTNIVPIDTTEMELLSIVAAAEKNSQHPLAEAIVRRAISAGIEIPDATEFDTAEGKGISCVVDGARVLIGKRSYLEELGVDVSASDLDAAKLESEAKTVVHAAIGGRIAGIIGIADTVRERAKEAIDELHRMGMDTMMITGDNSQTAHAIADKIGIKTVIADVLPQGKSAEVQKLQEQGKVVAFTGDGINDAPALARADVGIAMGGGTDIAIESGELVVMKDDPVDAVGAIQLSKAVLGRIKMNLFWAFAYNSILIPLAIFTMVPPEWAGLAMAMSSVTVVSLSLLLKRYVPPAKRKYTNYKAAPMPVVEEPQLASRPSNGPVLKCETCGKTESVPIHCNRPMHVEEVDGTPMLACWMGPDCGKQDIPVHHGKPMTIIENA